jgi:hypothetical protein
MTPSAMCIILLCTSLCETKLYAFVVVAKSPFHSTHRVLSEIARCK